MNVGDTVRLREQYFHLPAGTEGTIVEVTSDYDWPIIVNYPDGGGFRHSRSELEVVK